MTASLASDLSSRKAKALLAVSPNMLADNGCLTKFSVWLLLLDGFTKCWHSSTAMKVAMLHPLLCQHFDSLTRAGWYWPPGGAPADGQTRTPDLAMAMTVLDSSCASARCGSSDDRHCALSGCNRHTNTVVPVAMTLSTNINTVKSTSHGRRFFPLQGDFPGQTMIGHVSSQMFLVQCWIVKGPSIASQKCVFDSALDYSVPMSN